jgi:hypothetical protein
MAPPFVIVGINRRVILIMVTPHPSYVQMSEITQRSATGKLRILRAPSQESANTWKEHRIWVISKNRKHNGSAI